MNSNPDFSQLWKAQPAPVPDLASFLGFARVYRKKQSIKRWKTNAMLGSTVLFIGYIVFHFGDFAQMTIAGSLIVMLAVLLYLVMYNRMFAALGSVDFTENNREYLQQLLLYQKRQQFMQRQGISGYYILLCTGLSLYMLPFIRRMTTINGCVAIGLTAGWILFSWFYFRPRTIARDTAALKAVIDKYEKLNQQWETPGAPE